MDRNEYIQSQIELVRDNEEDSWKQAYYLLAIRFLNVHSTFEGGALVAYCRDSGLGNPHHPNVWPSMVSQLRKLGWIEKVGDVEPTTRYCHAKSVTLWSSRIYNGSAWADAVQMKLI